MAYLIAKIVVYIYISTVISNINFLNVTDLNIHFILHVSLYIFENLQLSSPS